MQLFLQFVFQSCYFGSLICTVYLCQGPITQMLECEIYDFDHFNIMKNQDAHGHPV